MKRTLTLATLLALGAAAYAPLPSMAQASYSITVTSAPPAPKYERVPAARPGYFWAPGHWEWRGHRHDWVQGYWMAERPGYVYTAPVWHQRDGGWYMEPARWSQHGRDRDHDGIPDRYEHRQERWEHERKDHDHDGVPDRYDHDRDGDGVPNYRDSAPNNPRRN
jgi:hypothetical protein